MTKIKKRLIKFGALACAFCLSTGFFISNVGHEEKVAQAVTEGLKKVEATFDTHVSDFFDSNVVYQVPDTVSSNEEVSVIVAMNTESILSAHEDLNDGTSVEEFAATMEANQIRKQAASKQKELIKKLDKSGIAYEVGHSYDTLLSGFEITIRAKDYEKVGKLLESSAEVYLGGAYEKAATQVVTNDVDVYETGIFDSSSNAYSGDGVVVAVLDSGLDYTHSAFSVEYFEAENPRFTLSSVSEFVSDTTAAKFTSGLKAEDVYMNAKIPFAYDYADKDTDVLPTNSDHGTHVSGVIAGKNNVITGVAPNAQIAFMKVFSDTYASAKTSWLLAALEDCVVLGVDVINMSLGADCGFTTDRDNEYLNSVYDKVGEVGISLIIAAANSSNATSGSEKNGSLGLTSNPDSGTVGSPSTYGSALSVASVDGVKTPYLKFNDEIVYFNEATDASAKTKKFVDELLATVGEDVTTHDFPYVVIPGLGRASDYSESNEFYKGKIVLVKRGTISFEDKIKVALNEKGAAGIIIYNNVSGTIGMSVGKVKGAACSISQDDGEMLVAAGSGVLRVSKDQLAGPFMSDFSSWGPTSDLQIKPEITAHGGEIYSAIPGEAYERQSGTSMASPNQAGATALIREYVKYAGIFAEGVDLSNSAHAVQVTSIVNQLMMSTTDIVYNKNGLPFAVRKQGSGLVNITKATTAEAYLTTYDQNGEKMSKAKFELGDDKDRSGVYTMQFDINNISSSTVTYDVDGLIITEGVSETYTGHDDTTVTQDGYLLDGARTEILSVSGGAYDGNTVTVNANGTATVQVKVTLSTADKNYLNESFAHGMYVEGFITLTAKNGTKVNLNAPMLAFYGDWTEAPIFDEEFYDTHKDELNSGLDPEDKLMADTVATKVLGRLYSDYIATMGQYYFVQDPTARQIAASKDRISMSNASTASNYAISGIYALSAGLLRNVRQMDLTVVEDSTGELIWDDTIFNCRKSFSRGSTMYPSTIDFDFDALSQNLKNNTKYTVRATAYIDYGENEDQKNVRNVFEFPLYIDFESPVVSDVTYRMERDESTKKTRLFADLYVYDNHYAMGVQIGQVKKAKPDSGYAFEMDTFGKYVTPVYSSFNSTSKVSIELTDYVADLKKSASVSYASGKAEVVENSNSMIAICYDYAMNSAVYELQLPDEILSMYFTEESISLSPNETKDLATMLEIFPSDSWIQVLDFKSSNPDVADVINQTVIAKTSGETIITASGYNAAGERIEASITVKVLGPEDPGYNGGYTIPKVNKFTVDGYTVNKAYYAVTQEEREIGLTGSKNEFDGVYKLSMFPSESVTLFCTLDSYFKDRTSISYKSSNGKVTVTPEGEIIAKEEGTARITVTVMFDGSSTSYSTTITVSVKDPFITSNIYLMSYKGLGDEVIIPDDRGITMIYSYAFSNYEYVPKGANDVIDDEDPYSMKQAYIGENTIKKVVIPEGVTTIESYAFAGLTALEEVVLPSTLTRIGNGAFYGCSKLSKVNFEHVKFINSSAFQGCGFTGELDFTREKDASGKDGVLVAISDYAFNGCAITSLKLPVTAESIGVGAFSDNPYLVTVEFRAPRVKIGRSAFLSCTNLRSIDINASVISGMAFYGCTQLSEVTLGKDVAVIGEYAFTGTSVERFELDYRNKYLRTEENGALLYKGDELLLLAPAYNGNVTIETDATSIATGAFAGNKSIYSIVAPNVTTIGAYAFVSCSSLREVEFGQLTKIGDYAFQSTALTETPDLSAVTEIGAYAFSSTKISTLSIADNTQVGKYAFAYCYQLYNVTIGDKVSIGDHAFYASRSFKTVEDNNTIKNIDNYEEYLYQVKDGDKVVAEYKHYRYKMADTIRSSLKSVRIGDNTVLGEYAFAGNAVLENLTLGEGVKIGGYAFYNATALTNVDLSSVLEIGEYAFSGKMIYDLRLDETTNMLSQAIEYKVIDDELVPVGYFFISAAPRLETISLDSATVVGAHSFEGNNALKSLTFGSAITEISDYAFAYTSIAELALAEQIKKIGEYTFFNSKLENVDLTNVDVVGNYSFAATGLKEVSLKESSAIGNGAFENCYDLAVANGLENVKTIGDTAFYATSLTAVNFVKTESVGDFAFAKSDVVSVTFGSAETPCALRTLGENPFYGCAIQTYGKFVYNEKAGKDELLATYDVTDTVKVIDEVLYRVTANGGMELISYPLLKTDKDFAVEEGTVRISARAFEGTVLESVTLPSTLKAIGDKAFYGCENLTMVVFNSYQAPILEEAFDISYYTMENIPFTGAFEGHEGLGISKYYMWNIQASVANFYYGANFVDYIGHIKNQLIMVKPLNGQNYNTFIFSQYFRTVVNGSNALIDSTLEVIKLINELPELITLEDEAKIVAIRTAYEKIPSLEQKALVSNYSDLTKAESTLEYLKQNVVIPDASDDSTSEADKGCNSTAAAVGVVGLLAMAGAVCLKKKRETLDK